MSGQYGVKATTEVLELVKSMALAVIAEAAKSGWKPADALAFIKSSDFEAKLKPVIDDMGQVVPEVTELDVWDDLALGKEAYGVVQEIVAALKTVKK